MDDFDDEALIYQLLTRGLAGAASVTASLDVTAIDEFPAVVFHLTGGNALDDSIPIPTAWEYALDLTVLAEGRDAARALARTLYRIVRGWNDPWGNPPAGLVDGLGHATEVTDRTIFTRTNQAAVAGKTIAQYDGGFDLQLHAA